MLRRIGLDEPTLYGLVFCILLVAVGVWALFFNDAPTDRSPARPDASSVVAAATATPTSGPYITADEIVMRPICEDTDGWCADFPVAPGDLKGGPRGLPNNYGRAFNGDRQRTYNSLIGRHRDNQARLRICRRWDDAVNCRSDREISYVVESWDLSDPLRPSMAGHWCSAYMLTGVSRGKRISFAGEPARQLQCDGDGFTGTEIMVTHRGRIYSISALAKVGQPLRDEEFFSSFRFTN